MQELPKQDPTDDPRVGPPLAVEGDVFVQLAQIAEEQGCQLLHVGRHGNALQLVIDHEDGVTLDHCSTISHEASDLLDALDYGKGRYVLEVTSPGIDREFYRLSDYQSFLGSSVKLVGRKHGQKATVRGELQSFDRESQRIQVRDLDTDQVHDFDLRDVQSTRLEADI